MKRLIAIGLLALATAAGAQSTAAKKEMVAKILQLQQPGIETLARALAQQPAALMMQRANNVLQARVPADKRAAVAKEIEADMRKYMDEAVPLVRERAIKLAPTTVGTLLEERFTEDELKQLIAIIESPVNRKFQQLGAEMQKGLADKLVAETKVAIEPKIRALEQTVAGRLGIPASADAAAVPGAAPAARPPARAASN